MSSGLKEDWMPLSINTCRFTKTGGNSGRSAVIFEFDIVSGIYIHQNNNNVVGGPYLGRALDKSFLSANSS